MSKNQIIQGVIEGMADCSQRKIIHLQTDNKEEITGPVLSIGGEQVVSFGSCSYMNLDVEDKLKQGVVDAVMKYGTQFSSSRTYLSVGLYDQLEKELFKIFQKPLIVTPTTTLGHQSVMPLLITKKDLVILDHQVHSSIQFTSQILASKKIQIKRVAHNNMEQLEQLIQENQEKFERIWYFADGIYSMYGDAAPVKEIEKLLNKYDNFHLYIDDAHGMSWTGKNGCGYVRSQIEHHDKMILAVSLNKTFACAGGCIIFPNEMAKKLVRLLGQTLIFSGPVQPPMLGACIASAKLHQTQEFVERQEDLKRKIAFMNQMLDKYGMVQPAKCDSPIFFVLVGENDPAIRIIQRMKEQGFYVNISGFPIVPKGKSGIRFMVTRKHTYQQISDLVQLMAKEMARELASNQTEQIRPSL